MTTAHRTAHPTSSRASRPLALRLLDKLFAAQALHRQHVALMQLDDALLRDIGITRAEAMDEAKIPVWNAPNHWQR